MGDVQVLVVPGIPEVRAGDDLVRLLTPRLADGPAAVRAGDVLCVSSKIVSKARGLVEPPERKDEMIARACVREVARRRHGAVTTRVVHTRSGPVLAGAGIDSSNAPDGILLLPEDPDAEAGALRRGLEAALGVRLGVILTDTSSRIWRIGVSDLALGASGLAVLQDERGRRDDAGRPLGVTVRALADEIAGAADLAKGKTGRTPVAIVRGLGELVEAPRQGGEHPGARALNRTDASDWFRRPSLESVWQALGLPLAAEPVAAMEPEGDEVRIARALQVACAGQPGRSDDAPGGSGPARARRAAPGLIEVTPAEDSPEGWAAAGALAERVRTALRAEEIAAPLPPWRVEIRPLGAPRAAHPGIMGG